MTDEEAHVKLYGSEPRDEREACAALMARHAAWLHAALRAQGLGGCEAEEGVVYAFNNLFRMLAQEADFPVKEERRLRGWLFKVGKDGAISEHRRNHETRRIAGTASFSQLSDDDRGSLGALGWRDATPEENAAANEFCQQVRAIWPSLTKKERVILLKDTALIATLEDVSGEDWDIQDEELAAEMDEYFALPDAVRRQRLKRVREKLRELFKERGDG